MDTITSKILPVYRKARRMSQTMDPYIVVAKALVDAEHFPLLIAHRWFYHSPDHSPYLQVIDESKTTVDSRTKKEIHYTSCLFLNRVVFALARGIGVKENHSLDLQSILRSMPDIQRLSPLNRDWFDCRIENISSKISKRSREIRDEKSIQRMLLDSERLTLEERRNESSVMLPSPSIVSPAAGTPTPLSPSTPPLSPSTTRPISLKGVLDEFDIPDESPVVSKAPAFPSLEIAPIENPLASSPKKDED